MPAFYGLHAHAFRILKKTLTPILNKNTSHQFAIFLAFILEIGLKKLLLCSVALFTISTNAYATIYHGGGVSPAIPGGNANNDFTFAPADTLIIGTTQDAELTADAYKLEFTDSIIGDAFSGILAGNNHNTIINSLGNMIIGGGATGEVNINSSATFFADDIELGKFFTGL